MLLQKEIAHDVIAYAISLGADFCELFIEKTSNQLIVYNSFKIKDITSGIDSGIGVRLIYGHLSLYAFSNSTKREDLLDMVKKLATQFTHKPNPVNQTHFNFSKIQYKEIKSIPNTDASLPEKI